ncbi:MAG: HEPN domain-containing protein, partial [Muribaculaceae bacterium]|nr:HEPN domain-containing protein [Muribaculaceae bacterium]
HAGVNRMINLHFVKSNIISKSDARLLLDLFNMRQTGDYDDIFDWTEEDIIPLLPDVESFVSKIIALINI